jgi:hypothetical protein
MGNHKMEHCWTQVNTTSPIMSKATIIKTQRQFTRIEIIQSFNVVIITTRVETIIAPNMDVVRK